MKIWPLVLGGALALSAHISSVSAQSKDKTAAVKSLVDSTNYVFHAQTALPMDGRTRQLTTDYTVTVTKNKITVDLPYYGRAYEAPADPSGGGIGLTSTAFDYLVKPRKKEGWDVTIKPKDNKDVQQIVMTISSEGYSNLQVISVNRQSISFNGIITPPTRN